MHPPAHDHAARRERARRLLAEVASVTLVTDPVHVRYLSGFGGSNGQVLLGRGASDDRLFTDERYAGRAEVADLRVVFERDPLGAAISAVGAGGALALEADHLTWEAADRARRRATAAGVRVVATTGAVARLRRTKDAAEIDRLTRACAASVAALTWLADTQVAVGRTERQLATALERRFVDEHADGVAFPSIVAAGEHAAIPHHEPTDRPLVRGDLLVVDCGALVDGYHADVTRTFAIGAVRDELAALHGVVVAAQAAARAAVRVGATGGDVDAAARDVVAAAGHADGFTHGTGHGVGLRIHEAPAVAKGSAATLEVGTALTVEPGVYLPGVGGVRIEDTLVITADSSALPLTDVPRELRVL